MNLLVGRIPADYSSACVAGWLSIYLSSPSNLVSTVIDHPLCNCLVKKVSEGTDVFTHKHTGLPTSSFSIVPCSVCSQAHMYKINYMDKQFFIITKPQDKNSLNWPVDNGHSRLGLQIYFFIISENAEHIDYRDRKRVGRGGYTNKMGYIYILILLINIILMNFHHLFLF